MVVAVMLQKHRLKFDSMVCCGVDSLACCVTCDELDCLDDFEYGSCSLNVSLANSPCIFGCSVSGSAIVDVAEGIWGMLNDCVC